MEQATKELYLNILKNKTLKCDIGDAIETLEGSDFANLPSQNGNILEVLKKFSSVVKDKIILSQYKVNGNVIMYWCCCNIDDILAVSGISKYSEDKQRYYINRIEREDQISFLGKDIKRAVSNLESTNKIIEDFIERFIKIEKPLGDLNYYTIFARTDKETNIQTLNCSRNLTLSPRKAPSANSTQNVNEKKAD